MGIKEDLDKIVKKYGLKADDGGDKNGNGDEKPTEETNQSDVQENEEEKEDTEEVDDKASDVVASLSDKIATKLVDAIAKNKSLAESDTKSLDKHIRSKVYTSWGGLKEVEYPSDLKSLTKEEKIVNFFKALYFHKADPQSAMVLRALVEGTDAEGGYLVPDELRAEVFRILPDTAVMRRLARILPMASDTLLLNSLTARPVAYWTAEYASKSTTSAEFGQTTLNANDLVCLLPVSDQLIADANINIVQFIIELFAEAIAGAEDSAFFTGSGTGQPRGINQETLSSLAVGGALDMDDIIDLIDLVPQRITQSPRSAFVGHRTVKRHARRLKDTTNNYIWRDGGSSAGSASQTTRLPDTLYGYPFFEQNDLGDDELYFGDWGFYIIGDRQSLSVRTTTEGGEAWRRNATEIKAVERVDGRAVITSAFAKLTGISGV